MTVLATIQEYFPPLSEKELAKAPKLSFDKTTFDFGKLRRMPKLKPNLCSQTPAKLP